VTEEVWSWWQSGSIHNARWPDRSEFDAALPEGAATCGPVLDVVAEVLGRVRRAKTTQKRSMRAVVTTLTVADTPSASPPCCLLKDDLRDAGG